ncbi:MAG TPA: hypothetical protein VF395_01895 [Polyangiaceae bacterium]
MSASLTILLVVIASGPVGEGSSEDSDAVAPAIARAARDALGPDTKVVLRTLPTFPSAADVQSLGKEVHADAVVEVAWIAPDHLRTIIRVERPNSERFIDRFIDFRAADDLAERNRTVGLAIASMLPDGQATPAAASPPEKREAKAARKVKRGPRGGAKPKSGESPESESPGSAKSPESPESLEPSEQSAPFVLHASHLSGVATLAFGVGDHAGAIGGALDFRHALGRTLSFRIGAGARVGEDPPAGVVTRFFYDATGLAWSGWATSNGRGSLGLRLDALLVLTQFQHSSAEGAVVNRYKLMPGGDLLVEAGYFFTRDVAVVVGGGGEAVFGQTDVFVGGRRSATLGPLHPVAELGLRVGF